MSNRLPFPPIVHPSSSASSSSSPLNHQHTSPKASSSHLYPFHQSYQLGYPGGLLTGQAYNPSFDGGSHNSHHSQTHGPGFLPTFASIPAPSPSLSYPAGRSTPALTYSKTSGSTSTSTPTQSGSSPPPLGSGSLLVSPMGSTPRARSRGKSVGQVNGNGNGNGNGLGLGAGKVGFGQEKGYLNGEKGTAIDWTRDRSGSSRMDSDNVDTSGNHEIEVNGDRERERMRTRTRTRTRTITGKSAGSKEDHPLGSMADQEGEDGFDSDVDMDAHAGGPGPPRAPSEHWINMGSLKASTSASTSVGRAKYAGSTPVGSKNAPLSSSSSGSASSKKLPQDRDRERERDSAYARHRTSVGAPSGPGSTSSALTDSNSLEANTDSGRSVGHGNALGSVREKERENGNGVITRSAAKGKGRDYGDRFIPQRDTADAASSYRLMPDHVAYSTGAGTGGIFGGDAVYLAGHNKISAGGSLRRGMGDERDDLKDEANRAYSQVLQAELYGTSPIIDRPRPTHSISAPVQPSRPAHSGLAPIVIMQGQYVPAMNALPPLPAHAPTASSPTGSSVFATTARGGSGSSSSMGIGASRMYQPGYIPPNAPAMAPPSTPSRKRMFNFQSPQSSGRSSPSGSTAAAAVSPGGFGLGNGLGTGVGIGLDDMMNEKYSMSPLGKESQRLLMSPRKSVRFISKTPFKVLDAPDLADDFYLNLVSWSNSNILGVGLATCVYLWSAHSSKVTKLCDLGSGEARPTSEAPDTVTGLEWTNRGSTIAIGTNKGSVEIWDTEHCKKIRTMTGHTGRVGALAWNDHILSTGSRDRIIFHRDVRAPSQHIRELRGHRQEVCGLRWNPVTDQLASGGNDNKLYIWDKTNDVPLYKFSEHCAAVKAITWSPHQRGLLASGGGTADKKIRFWNALTGTMISEWDTGAQVCNLMWSKNSNELVSNHGYSGGAISNQICVWRYPTMSQVATLSGHTYRVLYLAMSPDGQTIVTGAGDETLRFWNAFQKRRTGEAEANGMSEGVVGQAEMKDASVLNPFSRLR